jgi:UDP-N-acetylmuramate--alanine ligase
LRLHLLGIKGKGMRAVALAAVFDGAIVDGCDRRDGLDRELAGHGIAVAEGHDPRHADRAHIVATTAASPAEPELRSAHAAGRAHHRSDLLAALLRGRASVAVTGTHGKGTVAALSGFALTELGEDPLVILGLEAPQLGGSVRLGRGPAIVEADESDGSIARLAPDVSLVTNVFADHPQYGRSIRDTLESLAEHLAAVRRLVILGRGRNARSLAAHATVPVWRLGKDFDASVVRKAGSGASVRFSDPTGVSAVTTLRLRSPHLEEDAALAYAIVRSRGWGPEDAAAALGRLTRLRRRFEFLGAVRGIEIVDDYGKHPACIADTLADLRQRCSRRLFAIYEPHRAEHVRRWGSRFARSLALADEVLVLPLQDVAGGGSRGIAGDWPAAFGLRAVYPHDYADAADHIARRTRVGDLVCTLGVRDEVASLAGAVRSALRATARSARRPASDRRLSR